MTINPSTERIRRGKRERIITEKGEGGHTDVSTHIHTMALRLKGRVKYVRLSVFQFLPFVSMRIALCVKDPSGASFSKAPMEIGPI